MREAQLAETRGLFWRRIGGLTVKAEDQVGGDAKVSDAKRALDGAERPVGVVKSPQEPQLVSVERLRPDG